MERVMTKRIIVEVEDEKVLGEVMESLRRLGVRAKLEPDPEEVRSRILTRWRRLGRRAKPGELEEVSLEEEFD